MHAHTMGAPDAPLPESAVKTDQGMDRKTKNRRELSLLLKFRRSLRSP